MRIVANLFDWSLKGVSFSPLSRLVAGTDLMKRELRLDGSKARGNLGRLGSAER
jgi:hypothetical protein